MFSGFDDEMLAESFNVPRELARKLKNENDRRGIIVKTERELRGLIPGEMQEEEEEHRGRKYNGLEETLCSARWVQNIDKPSRADVYNPRAGRITTINSLNLPVLGHIRMSAQKGVLYKNAMIAPHWNINAHSICYITRGSGRIQIVGDDGKRVYEGEVREGQVLTAPQNFMVVKKAGDRGLEWISFKTSDHARISQVAGRVSVMRGMPEEVIENAYRISKEDARKMKYSREEVTMLSPASGEERA